MLGGSGGGGRAGPIFATLWVAGAIRQATPNSQNERKHFSHSADKDAAMGDLEKEKLQRAPGIVVRITLSSRAGGAVLKLHFTPRVKTLTVGYYSNMLEGDVFRQIDVVADGEKWLTQQDLASSHTAKVTKALLKRENVEMQLRRALAEKPTYASTWAPPASNIGARPFSAKCDWGNRR